MPPRPLTTVSLPIERVTQLRALADVGGTTIVGLIESLINRAIEEGELPDELPGYRVEGSGGFVSVTIPGHTFFPLLVDFARKLAAVVASGGKFLFPDGSTMLVLRVGRGIAIGAKDKDGNLFAKSTMTPAMAADLARMIRKAADASEG